MSDGLCLFILVRANLDSVGNGGIIQSFRFSRAHKLSWGNEFTEPGETYT